MNKKALIVWGGWDGHEPEKVAHRFGKILENENFDWAYSFNEMLVDDYPIKDRFVKIGDIYIDAENGSRKTDLDNEPENAGRSYDFEIKDDEIEAYIMGVTENYLIIMLCKDEARCYCLIEYK